MNKHYSYDEDHQMPEPTPEEIERQEGKRVLLVLFALLVVSLLFGIANANAQTAPQGKLDISWTLPINGCTQGVTPCDNVPLTGALALTGVNVYISTSPIANTSTMAPTLSLGPVTSVSHTMQVANGATVYVRLKAVNAHGQSPFSEEKSKLIELPVRPGVPSNVTISLTITP
jgi:hypothetical protein